MYAYLRGHSIIYFYKSKYKKGGAALKKAVYIALVCLIFCKLCACGIRETANNESSTESREEKSMVSNESVETSKEVENKRIIVNFEKMKGIWVSQYDMADVYCKDGVQRSKADYVSLVKTIISNIKTLGFNTVISDPLRGFHVLANIIPLKVCYGKMVDSIRRGGDFCWRSESRAFGTCLINPCGL